MPVHWLEKTGIEFRRSVWHYPWFSNLDVIILIYFEDYITLYNLYLIFQILQWLLAKN